MFAELTFIEHSIGVIICVLAFYMWLARKFMDNNPNVKDAAKKAVANKAINIIGRLFK